VIAYLFATSALDLATSGDDTLRLFRHIFPDKIVVTKRMLIEDWAGLDRKAGTDIYNDRICKFPGTFTRDEIVAHEDARLENIRAIYALDMDVDMDKMAE
jgi:hypothetical protein